ncbi:alpha/beta fold hydrolase [Ramlibacter pallidus]|uniref:Alpha/beta fold hydrolase n=1 Tax=Ramlibacter pallidus TaxID=2780087 RepID=A0ABR9S1X2_9BURK|nr:alpha/beta fold hydrolase [Ramlibacter pallidus]MBE7367509.1 alpha/beta fold hydrolase [Ramlibacter pallidus]
MPLHTIANVAVEDEGEGDAVVCLHGLGGTSNTWTPLMPALGGYRVIRPDLPGSGRSGAAGGELTIEKLTECVTTICQRLGVSRAHVLGHSMGTIVAQHLAVAQPRLVRSLALFGPLVAPPDTARANIRARGEKAQAEGTRGMHDIALALVNASLSADTRERQPVATAFVRESLMRQDPQGYARSCAALAATVAAQVERIEAPTLLVTGDEDGVAPPQAVRAMAERLAAAKGVRTIVLQRCGHWTPVERAEDCVRELRQFLPAQR